MNNTFSNEAAQPGRPAEGQGAGEEATASKPSEEQDLSDDSTSPEEPGRWINLDEAEALVLSWRTEDEELLGDQAEAV